MYIYTLTRHAKHTRVCAPITKRYYSILGMQLPQKSQYTKYRITKPFTENTEYDDLYLRQPDRDDLVKFTKEAPLFLRFLKLITDHEKRQSDFIKFAKRCESGLVVEKDAYITKKELIRHMWENGYTETEMNAYEIGFPSEYQFHYPELAALFSVEEEDAYKYCIKQRAASQDNLVEVKYKPTPNAVASYGVVTVGLWYGLSNTVLSNAWFLSKTWPFFAVFYMLGSYFQKNIMAYFHNSRTTEALVMKKNKEDGERIIHDQMRRYEYDGRCLDYMTCFKGDVLAQMRAYKMALLAEQKNVMTAKVAQHLHAVRQAEKAMQGNMQEVIVRECMKSFMSKFDDDKNMQDKCVSTAITALSGDEIKDDPVSEFFKTAFQSLQKTDVYNTKADTNGTIVERVAANCQKQETDFLKTFTVTEEDSQAVIRLVSKCKVGADLDFSKLNEKEMKELVVLYKRLNNKVGFHTFDANAIKGLRHTDDHTLTSLTQYVNQQVDAFQKIHAEQQLKSFARSFV